MQSIGDMRAIVSASLLVLLATAVGAEVQVIRPPKAVALLWTTPHDYSECAGALEARGEEVPAVCTYSVAAVGRSGTRVSRGECQGEPALCQVTVLDGDRTGATGWVPSAYLQEPSRGDTGDGR